MFIALKTHISSQTPPTDAQARGLLATGARYDAFSVNYDFRRTSVSAQRDLISEGHTRAVQALKALINTPPSQQLLMAPDTSLMFDRALLVMARLDCPPEIGPPTQESAAIQLPHASDSLRSGQNVGVPTWIKNAIIGTAVFVALSIVGFVVSALRTRAKSLAQRFVCEIPVSYETPDAPDTTMTTLAEDISRSGVKIASIDNAFPTMNSMLTIQLGPVKKQLQIRWGNTYFFGGQFIKPFTARELRILLGQKQQAISRIAPNTKQKRVKKPTNARATNS